MLILIQWYGAKMNVQAAVGLQQIYLLAIQSSSRGLPGISEEEAKALLREFFNGLRH